MSTLQVTLTPDLWLHCYLWPDSENSGCTQSGKEEKAKKEGVAETKQEKEERTGKWLGSPRELRAHSQDSRMDVKQPGSSPHQHPPQLEVVQEDESCSTEMRGKEEKK